MAARASAISFFALGLAAISTRSRDLQKRVPETPEDGKSLFQALPSRGCIDFGRQAWERRVRGGVPRYAGSKAKTSGCEEDPRHFVDAARENRQTLERVIEDFRRECNLLKAAKHPNVVEFIGVFNKGEGEESALLVMELMDQLHEPSMLKTGNMQNSCTCNT